MLKRYAQNRMNYATNEIRVLLQGQEILSSSREGERLRQLDRSYKFWKHFS
ncbi:hypothetical protein [Roseibium sp. MMSF_3544]|uniref:hypothetical protein n=1 Tax=unclassified Roseibium TaxID=2629323 RepID=UPI00273F67DE|nr:hypothetical protein [Roseibium sp. MMSF_3544]